MQHKCCLSKPLNNMAQRGREKLRGMENRKLIMIVIVKSLVIDIRIEKIGESVIYKSTENGVTV